MTLKQSRTFSRKMLWEAETCRGYGVISDIQQNSFSECIVISFIRLIFSQKKKALNGYMMSNNGKVLHWHH